jgi:20S proteasome subunit beta 2
MVTAMVSSEMKLHSYATGRPGRVVTVKTLLSQHLFRYQGHIGAALILAGVDLNGPHLYSVRSCSYASTLLHQLVRKRNRGTRVKALRMASWPWLC